MKRIAFLALVAANLGGCASTLSVAGQVQNSPDTLTGSATSHMDGSGDLAIRISSGATCTGRFAYKSMRGGEGVLTCSDGRSGPFHFVLTDPTGSGEGDLGGQHFTFTLS